MSVRGGRDYDLNPEAKKYVKNSNKVKVGGWFRGLFWWCTGRSRQSSNKGDRDIQPHKKSKKKNLKQTSNCKRNIIIL